MAPSASDPPKPITRAPSREPRPETAAGGLVDAVSIIVCTRDRRADLARALASVAAAGPEAPWAEVVVVEETDAPRPILGTTYVAIPGVGLGFGHARNRGVAEARGDILVFLDDDCEARPGWLTTLLGPLRADPSVAGAAGAVLVRECNLVGYAENILGFPGGGLRYLAAAGRETPDTRYLSTCNCAYRRRVVEEAGGFPEATRWGGEDALLAERVTAKHRAVYVPEAAVFHRPRGSLVAIFRWFVRRGRSEIQILPHRLRPRAAAIRLVWTSILLRAGALAAVLPVLPLPVPVSLGLAALAYYGLLLWRYRFARRFDPHRRAWPLAPLVKLTMDLGMEAGKLRELLSVFRRAARGRRPA